MKNTLKASPHIGGSTKVVIYESDQFIDDLPPDFPVIRPGQQLKLVSTNIHDDILDILTTSQSIADKFYSSRTIKSSIALRKVYLQISKLALHERKRIIIARNTKKDPA